MDYSRSVDPSKPDPARRYNYWLGGKDNFRVDRESGDLIEAAFPMIAIAARENREFLKRVVTAMASVGVAQFLDIGAGLPSADNTHEVAQRTNPKAKVVYVDNSPLVLTHARALLVARPGASPTAIVEGDLRNPADFMVHADLRDGLDWTRPIGLLLIAVLHFIGDEHRPYDIVTNLIDALPSGSWLALSQIGSDLLPADLWHDWDAINTKAGIPMAARSRDEIARFFAGLDLASPGIVPIQRWRPDAGAAPHRDTDIAMYGGLARKP